MDLTITMAGTEGFCIQVGEDATLGVVFGLVEEELGRLGLSVSTSTSTSSTSATSTPSLLNVTIDDALFSTASAEVSLRDLSLEAGSTVSVSLTRAAEARLTLRSLSIPCTPARLLHAALHHDAHLTTLLETQLLTSLDIAGVLCSVAQRKDVRGLRALLQETEFVNPNQRNASGSLALIECMREGEAAAVCGCVAVLLEYGAELEKLDRHATSPLMAAAEEGGVEVVQHLVEVEGAAVNTENTFGSALCSAACGGCVRTLWYLLQKGADAGWRCAAGRNALHRAVSHNRAMCARLLCHLDRTLSTAADLCGDTPLHVAASFCYRGCIAVLLEGLTKAEVNLLNQQGNSALMLVARQGAMDPCGQLLLDKGADPALMNHDGLTAIELAMECGHYEAAEKLRTSYVPY